MDLLNCKRELINLQNCYIVTVKNVINIRCVSRKVSKLCYLFLNFKNLRSNIFPTVIEANLKPVFNFCRFDDYENVKINNFRFTVHMPAYLYTYTDTNLQLLSRTLETYALN